MILDIYSKGFSSVAQTIVSTTPENKKVVLEEFTGIHCVYCPQGHAIAQAIQNNNPGEVFLINIHVGGFAVPNAGEPDFRTPFGTAIANQSGLTGYPAGTVNRHVFPGSSQSGGNDTAMSRGRWTSASNQILGEASYMNMAVEADLNYATGELTVHVEAYYTGNSPEASNLLNVALLQNNTLGPQTGGGAGNNYVHQHRLVYLLTGQWGESISPTTQGTFIERDYTYNIPAMYNNVPVELEDMELVVFMTETTQELISGNGAYPTFTNLPLNNDAAIEADFDIDAQCGIDYAPTVTIQNRGNNPLTSLDIDYSINGGTTYTYTWTGNLGGFEKEDVTLDPIPYTVQSNNTINFSIPSDEDNANNTASNTFQELTQENTGTYSLTIVSDDNGDEITWQVIDVNNTVVESGGPYDDNTTYNIGFHLPDAGCYQFKVTDSGGDGAYYVWLKDSEGENVILNTGSPFGSELSVDFRSDGVLGVNDSAFEGLYLVPNPANTRFTIGNAQNANLAIFDIMGRKVLSQNNLSQKQEINVSNLTTGTYFVQLEREGQLTVEKLIVN